MAAAGIKGALATRKVFSALFITVVIIIGGMMFFVWPEEEEVETRSLPEDYIIFVQYPETEKDMEFIASLSSISVSDGRYHPVYVLGRDGTVDDKIKHTIMQMGDFGEAVAFIDAPEARANFEQDFGAKHIFPRCPKVLESFRGYSGTIKVSSYEEALWAAPVAAEEQKLIVPSSTSTYSSQSDAWNHLKAIGKRPNYVVVANPKDLTNESFDKEMVPYHIPALSAASGLVAAYHGAYVLTSWEPSRTEIGYMEIQNNTKAIGIYEKLRKIWSEYGEIEYIALVGSSAAVPQFQLPDKTSSNPDSREADGIVSSDVVYGFLDEDMYTMDAAVGRLVNWNLEGLSNQLARTYRYEDMASRVRVKDSTGQVQEREWRTHGSIWNGYEVADQRLQMTPGWFAKDDMVDEGLTYDYMRTTGNEGWRDAGTGKERDFKAIMESSNFVFYRGHGSWHATFYVWKPSEYQDPSTSAQYRTYIKDRLEGNCSAYSPEADFPSVDVFNLPPQFGLFVCCENSKIEGTNWIGTPVDIRASFPLHYMYAGAVGMISATEVSFSNLGQDIYSSTEEYLPGILNPTWSDGDYEWDMNDFWYACVLDAMLNHESDYGYIGKALQWGMNRYMSFYARERGTLEGYPEKISPLYQDPGNQYWQSGKTELLTEGHLFKSYSSAGTYWKEVAMFACYGDPAFKPYTGKPGPNSYDPWHNGPEDI